MELRTLGDDYLLVYGDHLNFLSKYSEDVEFLYLLTSDYPNSIKTSTLITDIFT